MWVQAFNGNVMEIIIDLSNIGEKEWSIFRSTCYAIFSGVESNYFPAKGKSRDSNYSTNNDFEIMLT